MTGIYVTKYFHAFRLSIADIFQSKKRRKREAQVGEVCIAFVFLKVLTLQSQDETIGKYEFDYDDIWDDYDDYSENDKIVKKQRINFKKYGTTSDHHKRTNEVMDDLPRNIYCDLVNTLNSKCAMGNLLEIWRL